MTQANVNAMSIRNESGATPYPPDLVRAVEDELRALASLSQPALMQRYRELLGRQPPIRDRRWLKRRVAIATQAKAFGSLSEKAKARLREVQAILGITLEKDGPTVRSRIARPARHDHLAPGSTLRRVWRGKEEIVIVREDGKLEWDGRLFDSLTAVAREISQQGWSGPLFFGLRARSRKR